MHHISQTSLGVVHLHLHEKEREREREKQTNYTSCQHADVQFFLCHDIYGLCLHCMNAFFFIAKLHFLIGFEHGCRACCHPFSPFHSHADYYRPWRTWMHRRGSAYRPPPPNPLWQRHVVVYPDGIEAAAGLHLTRRTHITFVANGITRR
jgi:hypothetical protein